MTSCPYGSQRRRESTAIVNVNARREETNELSLQNELVDRAPSFRLHVPSFLDRISMYGSRGVDSGLVLDLELLPLRLSGILFSRP
jgi:hypothetical protein